MESKYSLINMLICYRCIEINPKHLDYKISTVGSRTFHALRIQVFVMVIWTSHMETGQQATREYTCAAKTSLHPLFKRSISSTAFCCQ